MLSIKDHGLTKEFGVDLEYKHGQTAQSMKGIETMIWLMDMAG